MYMPCGEKNFWVVDSHEEAREVLARIIEQGIVGLDLETTGLNPWADKVVLCSLTDPLGNTFLLKDKALKALSIILGSETLVVGHNLKFDLQFLIKSFGRDIRCRLFDTMLAALLLNYATQAERGRVSLDRVLERYIGVKLDKTLQKSDWAGELSKEQMEYAARDTKYLLELHKKLGTSLNSLGLGVVASIENEALPVLAEMELFGVGVDEKGLWKHYERLLRELLKIKKEAEKYGGVNLNSPIQVKQKLRELGVEVSKTDSNTLAGIKHEFAKLVLTHREKQKDLGFVNSLTSLHPVTDRIHPEWHQIGAATGRMACRNPNMQQTPRTLRGFVCSSPECRLIVADYSQIEIVIAAKVYNDPVMLEAIKAGEDIHKKTASLILSKPVEEVKKGERQMAKALNFGLLYGMGAKSLQEYARVNYGVELTFEQAKEFRDRFFKFYTGIKSYHDKVAMEVETNKNGITVQTLTGRKRFINQDKGVFTAALNTPVQGTGADMLKAAAKRIRDEIISKSYDAVVTLLVHDEIVVEVKTEQANDVREVVEREMEKAGEELLGFRPGVEVMISDCWQK